MVYWTKLWNEFTSDSTSVLSRKKGYEVNILNYEVPPLKSVKDKKKIIKRIVHQPKKYVIKLALHMYKSDIETRNKKLCLAIKKYCILTPRIRSIEELINVCNSYDLLICGSDQIWNPNWYDRFYLLIMIELKLGVYLMPLVWG